MDNDKSDPESQPPTDELLPGDGDSPPPPHLPPVSITNVSPIGAALAGGITITITGSGFQPDAEVFFGSNQSPEVIFESSTTVKATLPAAAEPGSVALALFNPDGANATREGAFTYITMDASGRAEVLGVEPLAVIEDTPTQVTLRGRNLIAAYNDGLLLLRGAARANIEVLDFVSNLDKETEIEELTITVRVTASPPLAPEERLIIQILASRRAGALTDGFFESSRQVFTVLPANIPVLLGYSAIVDPSRPNLVVVAGRNLEGCSLDLGENAVIHLQKSEDDLIAGIVTFDSKQIESQQAAQLSVRNSSGKEVGRYSMAMRMKGESLGENSPPPRQSLITAQELPEPGDIGLELIAAPEQQLVAPTEEDSAVFTLGGKGAISTNLSFDWSNYDVARLYFSHTFHLINIVRLVPFFDGGGDELDLPVRAQLGSLFRLRGTGLLIALRVQVTITVTVVIIIAFVYNGWGNGYYNEFPEFSFGIGSLVITFQIQISIEISISSLTALVLPGGHLRVLALFELEIGIDFTITNDGLHLHFVPNFTHKVIFVDFSPFNNLLPCDGRFQLAEENGQRVFPDAFGGYQSFYFARAAGTCCLSWRFNLSLVRFTASGPEITVQQPSDASFCVTPEPSPGFANIIITSEHPEPTGIPPHLNMTFDDRAALFALAVPVDANGNPTGSPPQDVRTLGYDVEFYLDPLLPDVLDPTLVGSGDAAPILAGDNIIHARIWRRQGEVQFFTFAPGTVLGFAISSFLARNLPPAVLGGTLPVTVQDPTKVVVTPTLAYIDAQTNQLTEAPSAFTIPDGSMQAAVREVERYEPYEYDANNQSQQLDYVVAVRLSFPSNVLFPRTVRFKVDQVSMRTLNYDPMSHSNMPPPGTTPPLDGTGFGDTREGDNLPAHFFQKIVHERQEVFITFHTRPAANALIQLTGFTIAPNTRDDVSNSKLVPPGKLVANRHVMLLIDLSATSKGLEVASIKQLKLVVRNDETYEEYVRVFPEIQTILTLPAFRDFARNFYNALPSEGHPSPELLDTKGKELWTLATTQIETTVDDRPLYWARLQTICALRAYYKRNHLGEPNVSLFEWPSRGLEQVTGGISFASTPANTRQAIVTGFDPFQLAGSVMRSNPSGLIALSLDKQPMSSIQGAAYVRTAIFPVRYRDFDDRLVEKAIGPNINSIALLMTCSQGINLYDVDRFAAKNREPATDNEHQPNPGTVVPTNPPPPDNTHYTVPRNLNVPDNLATQFIESTLPYERVITSDPATRKLPGPQVMIPGQPFNDDTGFVLNQAFSTFEGTNQPYNDNPNDPKAFVKLPIKPESNLTSEMGSGGGFLSNEIFYRTALLRSINRPALPSGHLHVPILGVNPQSLGAAMIYAGKKALMRFLDDKLRLRSLGDVTFPDTGINRMSAPRALIAKNETNEVVGVVSVEIDPPGAFTLQSALPAQASPNANFSLLFTFSPTQVRVYKSMVRVHGAGGEILFSEQLTGTGVALPPAPIINGFDPTSGEIGDEVIIFGENLDGATSVKIGTVSVSFTPIDNTQISAMVAGPPRVVPITVVTPSGTATSAATFRVIHIFHPPE